MSQEEEYYADVGIIGGGVGGLGAAIIAAYKGLKVTLFEGGSLGGIVTTLYSRKIVENYPGLPSVLGKRLVDEFVIQAHEVQAEIKHERVVKVHPDKTIETNEGKYKFKTIIIATGSQPAELGIPGERKFKIKNRGVFNFVTDPEIFKHSKVLVVGGGDTAIDAVYELQKVADEIYLVHRRDSFRGAEMKAKKIIDENKAEVILNSQVVQLKGEKVLEKAVIENINTKMRRELEVDKCILAVGMKTNLEIFKELGLQTDGKLIKVDKKMRTNVPGIFAVGDITSRYQLIVIAVAQGAIAAHHAFEMIRKPYWASDEPWPTEIVD
ncbi:MAG: NAD(P)/FAD-dependent oxidoreductase [Candidatus Heimdallarchaeaceae archaeon]